MELGFIVLLLIVLQVISLWAIRGWLSTLFDKLDKVERILESKN